MAPVMALMKRLTHGRTQIEGELGYFGLGGWWCSALTKAERNRVEACYRPDGVAHAKPLTTGRSQSNFRTAAALLASITTYLREEPQDRNLALKVLAKAEERARTEDDIVGLHCVYQEMIRLHTKWRDHFLDGLDLIFGACHKQVALSTLAAAALRELRPEAPLPTHLGFQVMAKLLEQEGSYTKALEMCKEAREQGWAGNWTWKIGCLAKQRQAQDTGVTYISRSGITPI